MDAPDPLAIAVRFATYLDLMILFGMAVFGLYALRGTERFSRSVLPLRTLLLGGSVLALALTVSGLWVLAASMAGTSVAQVDGETITAVLATPAGTSIQIRTILLLLVLASCARRWRERVRPLATGALLTGAALLTLAWSGHGAAGEGALGTVRLASDGLHLLAAGVWIGAIFALLLLVARRGSSASSEHVALTHRSLSMFSVIGSLAVATLVATGLFNGWALAGLPTPAELLATTWGVVLVLKLLLFTAMLGLAALNRFRLTPRLERSLSGDGRLPALRELRASLVAEALLGTGVLALVSWLGLLAPPA